LRRAFSAFSQHPLSLVSAECAIIREMTNILVVDDDQKLLNMLRRTLTYEGFHVSTAADGNAALAQVPAQRPDVIVLDWLMPGLDGIRVMKQLRAADDKTLILMLTARDAVENRVEGLESGADDYLVKPFAPAELLARIHALLRRSPALSASEPLAYADLYLNPVTRETRRGERSFDLTSKEFDLLQYLLGHPRQVLHRDQILQQVWGYDFGGDDNVLEVYVGYLRKKTEAGGEPRVIQTVRGVGYVLREE
jgi:two-component system response regulator MprA